MKKWEVINTEIIPKLEYVTKLSFGEDGLSIDLIDEQYCTYIVNLYFGKVISYRCIDEGDMLFIPYTDEESFLSYRESAFTDILFRLNGDNYFHEIKNHWRTLYCQKNESLPRSYTKLFYRYYFYIWNRNKCGKSKNQRKTAHPV